MIRQKSRSLNFISHLILLTFLVAQIPVPAFASETLPTNPDDYDVSKYQRILEDAGRRSDQEDRLMAQLQTAADQAASNLAASQQHLATLNDRLSRSNADLAALQKETSDLESEATRLQNTLSSLSTQIQDALAAQRDAEARLSRIQGDLDAANREIAAKQSAYDSKNRELQPIQNQIAIKQGGLDSAKVNLQATRGRITANRSEKTQLEAKLSDLRGGEAPMAASLERARTELTDSSTAVEKAQADVVATGNELRSAEQHLREAQTSGKPADVIAKLQIALDDARAASQAARAQFAQAANRKKDAGTLVAKLTSDLSSIRAEIPNTEKRIADLGSQIPRDEQIASTLETQISTLSNELASLRASADALSREVASLKADLDRVKAATETVRTQAATLQAQVNDARTRANTLQAKLDQAKRQITENQAKVTQNRDRIAKLRDSLPILQRERDQTVSEIENGRNIVSQANAAAQGQKNRVRDAHAIEQQAEMRFRVVQTNLQRGLEVADREGRHDGREAAGREGQIRGAEAGSRDGAITGDREGTNAGKLEGIRVAQAQGTTEGNRRGTADGTAAGRSEGTNRGYSEGAIEGHDQGIAQGRDQGKQKGANEGSAEGIRVGHTLGSYERGVIEGTVSGNARGESEGSEKGLTDGTKQADREALGAKLINITIPVSTPASAASIQKFLPSFTQSLAFTPSYFSRYPIPALDRAYDAAYQETYRTVYDAQYSAAAAAAYDQAYQVTYRTSYDRAVGGNFDAEYRAAYSDAYGSSEKQAHDSAYRSSYKTSYDSAYNTEFDKVFNGSYDDAYRLAYQAAYEKSRDETSVNDLAKGRKDGDRSAYAKTFPVAYAQAKSDAYTARKQIYDSSAVLQLQNATVLDENQDGVNVPGEAITLNVGVKNFGRITSGGDVRVELSVPSSGLEVFNPTTVFPAIPGVSNALIQGVAGLRIRPTASIGSKESVTVSLVAGGTVIGSSQIEITVGTTLSLSLIEVAPKVSAKNDNSIRIVVKNLSKKAFSSQAQVEVYSTDALATISSAVLPLGPIAAATTQELKTSFRFLDAPAPDKLSFQVLVRVGDATYDSRILSVKSAERFAYNSASKGVLLVNTADTTGMAQQARKASGLGFDLYDERQEGALSATTAAKYASKLIVIPEASAMKSATVASVKAAITKGAHLLIGLDDKSAKSEIGMVAITAAKKNPTRDLLGLRVSERNVFKTDSPKSKILLSNPASSIGIEGLANALEIADITLKSVTDKTKDLLAANALGDIKSADFLKVALTSELSQEMQDDLLVSGKNFEKTPSKLKLTAVMTILQGATREEKKIIGGIYTDLETTRIGLAGREARKAAIQQILAPLKAASGSEPESGG